MPLYSIIEELKTENLKDPNIISLLAKYFDPDQQDSSFTTKEGCLFFKDRCYISEHSTLLPQILWEFHDSKLGGHAGILRTSKRISKIKILAKHGEAY